MISNIASVDAKKPREYENILIIKLSSLGDICHALPSLTALRNLYPHAKISWAVNKPFADLLTDHPLLDEVIVIDQKAWTKGSVCDRYEYFKKLRGDLKKRQFDLVLDLQGLLKSSVIALMTGCKTRYGYWEMREGSWLVTKGIKGEHSQDHVIQRYLDVIRFLGSDVREPEFVLPDIDMERSKVDGWLREAKEYVVIAPATSWDTKEWSLDNYVQLTERLLKLNKLVVLVGGSSDVDKSAYITEQLKLRSPDKVDQIVDLTGRTTLKELMAVCKGAQLYISGDTGPLHIAVATGVPIVAMYGPTMPHRTGPYVGKCGLGKTRILIGQAECRPCRQKKCSKMDCMRSIDVDEVMTAAKYLLRED